MESLTDSRVEAFINLPSDGSSSLGERVLHLNCDQKRDESHAAVLYILPLSSGYSVDAPA